MESLAPQPALPVNPSGLIVLDIDGTLTDTVELHQAALLKTMQSFNFPVLDEDWSRYRHHTDSAIFAEAWEQTGWRGPLKADRLQFSDRFERAFEYLRPAYPIREIPGAAVFVRLLLETGWLVAFGTGGLREPSRTKLREAGIPFTENLLATASEYVTREEIVSAAISAAAANHPSLQGIPISLGDGLWDLLTAKTLGLNFLGVGIGPKAQNLVERGATVLPNFSAPTDALRILAAMIRQESRPLEFS